MISSPFLKTNNNLKKYIITYIISLIPILLYGVFTNGLKALLIILITILIASCVELVYRLVLKNDSFNLNSFLSINLYSILIAILLPLNLNLFLYSLILVIDLFLYKILNEKIPLISFAFIVVIIMHLIFKNNLFVEQNELLNFNNHFIGYLNSNLFTSSIILSLLGLSVLCNNPVYKKDIAITCCLGYIILLFVLAIISNDLLKYFNSFIFSYNLFAFIFIAPISKNSCYTTYGKFIYSLIIIIISFIFTIFDIYYGCIIGIFIANILFKYIDEIILKLNNI